MQLKSLGAVVTAAPAALPRLVGASSLDMYVCIMKDTAKLPKQKLAARK
jgi:hypothetical protein